MAVTTDVRQLMQRFSFLENQRTNYEWTMQEITDLFMPYRGDITTRYSPGERRKPLFDSFGAVEADRFVNFLNGTLYPSSSDWVKYRVRGAVEFSREIDAALYDILGVHDDEDVLHYHVDSVFNRHRRPPSRTKPRRLW